VVHVSHANRSSDHVDQPAYLGADHIRSVITVSQAADSLEAALEHGLDPEVDTPRHAVSFDSGELLVMPSAVGRYATVKLVTVGGTPRIQGFCAVFEPRTLAPVAILDGAALTTIRTAAISLVAARRLAPPRPRRLLIFGRGPQGLRHAEALEREFDLEEVSFAVRDSCSAEVTRLVSEADVICCATNSRTPLFDGRAVSDRALVIAIGSHEPTAREVDEHLVGRATLVVEAVRATLREAGDLIMAGVRANQVVNLAQLVSGWQPPPGRPRLFKSTGMSWEDNVVANAIIGRTNNE
jgi:ornithine cyclodeaminase/alanine dehydrogenase-like protein (mu-crystallin family)